MYDINTKNVKKGKNFYLLFLLAGLVFLAVMGAILIGNYTKLKSLDSTTLSTRVVVTSHKDDEGSIMYSPIYYYMVDGKEYTCSSNMSSSSNPGTSNKTVYYDSKDPANCMSEYTKSGNKFIMFFLFLPFIFIAIAVVNMRKVSKRVKQINELNKKGKLVKNLPYHLENTGTVVNNVPIQRPVVDYCLPSGLIVTLYGDPRNDKKAYDADGMVDLVIDESNPDNYFIDFEINRLTGNLPSDFYNDTQNNGVSSNNNYNQVNNQNIPNNGSNANPNNIFNQPSQPAFQQQVQPQVQNNQSTSEQNSINQNNNI